ncbi:MAG: choloylglycine hydrolase family protein [Campylobacterota bacterium]|nr:choloylglycine hydrolase family protein [Campylobacterota bacterium]
MNLKRKTVGLITLAIVAIGVNSANACTGISLTAEDSSVVHARTLEFAIDLKSNVMVVPRGYSRTGTAQDGKKGLKWRSKYASLGANGLGVPFLFDGFNEKGLAIGLLYHPDTAKYMKYNSADLDKTLAPWELGSWILENFANVEEVKANISKIVVPEVVFAAWGFSPQVHYTVQDASGGSIVIEFIDGKLVIYDNPLGVLTNSPAFDWHMTNLRNYINLTAAPAPQMQLKSIKLKPLGMGSGFLGIPGDSTPPSRFVRAALFSQTVFPSKTGYDAILEAFHILNNFDIPKGSAQEGKKDKHGNILVDYTAWTSASDLKAKRFYFRTYENSQIRMVDLNKMNLDAEKIIIIPMKGKEIIKDLTPHR